MQKREKEVVVILEGVENIFVKILDKICKMIYIIW
jgi:hypothetical protein